VISVKIFLLFYFSNPKIKKIILYISGDRKDFIGEYLHSEGLK